MSRGKLRMLISGIVLFSASAHLQADWNGFMELATDDKADDVNVIRAGLQIPWDSTWLQSDAGQLGGYWKVGAGYWDADDTDSDDRDLFELFVTPVFQYRFSRFNGYLEVGVGAHLLSEKKIASYDLSSDFQFGSHLGFGLLFGARNQFELGYRIQHLSNAGLKQPNDGIDLHVLHLGYRF